MSVVVADHRRRALRLHTTTSMLVTAAVNPAVAGDAVTKLNETCHRDTASTLPPLPL
jgi:hypothetical protein